MRGVPAKQKVWGDYVLAKAPLGLWHAQHKQTGRWLSKAWRTEKDARNAVGGAGNE